LLPARAHRKLSEVSAKAPMTSFSIALVCSFLVTGLIVRISRSAALAWDDHQLTGAQKFHARAVPRVGGVAVVCGLLVLTAWVAVTGRGPAREIWLILLCGAPALLAGLAEDFTKRVSARFRLAATMLSGLLA